MQILNCKVRVEYVCLLMVWTLITAISCFLKIENGGMPFSDTDDYMRLVYLLEYLNGNLGWYDHIISRSNVPFGCDIHWTHLYDLVLMAGTYVFRPLCASIKEALFTWAIFVTPVITCFSIVTLYKVFRHFLSKDYSALLVFFFMLHPIIYAQIRAFRPDHHAFLILLAIVMVKYTLDFINELGTDNYKRPAIKLGIAYALSITASPELLLVLLPIELFFVLYWIGFRINPSAIAAKSWYWTAATAICYVIFSSDGWHTIKTIDYDKISIVHVSLALASAIFWTVISYFNKNISKFSVRSADEIKKTTILALCAGLPIIAAIFIAFPDIIYLMSGKISPVLREQWLSKIAEMKSPIANWNSIVSWIALVIFCLGLHGAIIFYRKYLHTLKKEHRFILVYIIFVLFLYAIAGGKAIRVLCYFSMFSLPFALLSLLEIQGFIFQKTQKQGQLALISFLIMLYVLPYSITFVLYDDSQETEGVKLYDVIGYLKTIKEPMTILAPEAFGPAIIFVTNHNIIFAPYHRQEYGLLAGCKVYLSPNGTMDDLRKILKTSDVKCVVVTYEKAYSSICKKLVDGDIPEYLEKVDNAIKNAVVFRVKNERL